jgi:hypothetical protein
MSIVIAGIAGMIVGLNSDKFHNMVLNLLAVEMALIAGGMR